MRQSNDKPQPGSDAEGDQPDESKEAQPADADAEKADGEADGDEEKPKKKTKEFISSMIPPTQPASQRYATKPKRIPYWPEMCKTW